ncbi:MAG: restriction endonuclease subunit R, partial [Anaerolineae bacterium]|nr:restriction endonuclease subunit R [Anaerolineae bacterium]
EDFRDYRPEENDGEANRYRKARLWDWYQAYGLREDFSVDPDRLDRRLSGLLTDRYETRYRAGHRVVPYESFLNRMGFWMATLVIVKLVEILWRLIRRGEIPPHPILVLTHRDDLLEQLRRHVEEFNRGGGEPWILLRDLREYPQVLRESPTLFREREALVYVYRSDNLSDIQKERIVD